MTPPPVTERRVAIVGALMVMLGPVSLALYTPALPTLVLAFGTTEAMLKLSVTVYFFGFAFAQLVCGPMSDAWGRRPVALGFFSIYLGGSVLAAAAPTVEFLLAGRALQGIGVAAGVAISRAIVRDLFVGQASARIMNLIGLILAIAPLVSPLLGGVIVSTLGWHPIFLAMVIFGVAVMLALAFGLPETNAAPDPELARPARVMASYRTLLADRAFMRSGLALGIALGGLYTQAALLPFVLIGRLGLTPTEFGLTTVFQTGSYAFGAFVTGRLLARTDAMRLVPVGLGIVAAAGAALFVAVHVLPPTVSVAIVPSMLWAFGIALLMPGAMTGAMAGFGAIAGAASALLGFLQIAGGFAGSGVAALFPDPLVALAVILPVMAGLAGLAHLMLRPRRGTPVARTPEPTDIEIAADPAGLIGAAGDEIEAERLRKSA